MILGIGTDITRIRRIEMALISGGWRFKNRVFTPHERDLAEVSGSPGVIYARRWAAKEACLKALGCGQNSGIGWKEIEILKKESGQPALVLHGAARDRLEEITPAGMTARLHVSLSDEPPFSMAFVIIDATKL